MNRPIETTVLPNSNLEIYEAETFFKAVLDSVNPGLSADESELQGLDDMPADPTGQMFAKAEETHLNKLSPFRLAQPPAPVQVARPLTAAQEEEYRKGFDAIVERAIDRIAAKLDEKLMALSKWRE